MIERNREEQPETTPDSFTRIMHRAANRAKEESRAAGVPVVHSINGIIYYELPDGSLSREDPWQGETAPPDATDEA